ncbi:MAG: lamin tail domain-containing protein [Bacteroidales bacterium]|nr:lamin tail domain-containing protein [Bacteroidales bacterium]
MKKKLLLMLVAFMAISTASYAQGRKGLCINEVMVQNDSSVVDDYGLRHGWIELYNSTHAPMEISSVYLTNDSTKPTLYPVPLGDVNTEIPALQHVIFWADGEPNKGTFHISFQIKPGETIYIFDADQQTILDKVTIPTDLKANTTFARKADGKGGMNQDAWEVRDGGEKYITPSSNNIIVDTNTKVESFRILDKSGVVLTIMAMAIVFGALLVLCLCFYAISKIGSAISKTNKMRSQGVEPKTVAKEDAPGHDSGEEIAAIVMALHEHLNAHDQENTILTINKVKKAYSPWSSKIYGLRELPRR